MNKKLKLSLITIIATLACAIVIAVSALLSRPTAAFADRYVTVDGSNVFYTSIRGAEVTAGKETVKNDENADEDHYYTLFKIGKDETVSYRKSLAYRWIGGHKNEDGTYNGEQHSFSMQIGFDSFAFEKFIIRFQSQQYLYTDKKISENFLVFTPNGEGKVGIAAVQNIDDEINEYPVTVSAADNARILIAFGEFKDGDVSIEINGKSEGLTFKNIYYPYVSYVSSGDTAVTPLTFSAKFDDRDNVGNEEDVTADMKLYELNGQSFELYAHDTDGIYNDVKDDTPPAMCFTKTPSYVEFGKTIKLNYQVIDVLATSPRSTACYYVLTGKQYLADDFNYSKIEYDENTDASAEDKDDTDEDEWEYPYTKVTSGSDVRVVRDSETFVPFKYLEGGEEFNDDYTVYGLIKIYYDISDYSGTGSDVNVDKICLEWYAKPDALVNIYSEEYKNVEGKTDNFLKIIDGKKGVTYAASENESYEQYIETVKGLETDYQEKIDNYVAGLEDGKLYAGKDSNFYLPAFDLLFGDEYFYTTDYKFTIYYKAKTSGSTSSLDYNKLAIPLNEADVEYMFTVYITDSFGNNMRYPAEDGTWKEIKKDDIWDEDNSELLPFFTINVSYKEATAKNPESLAVAYVGTSYSSVSFDIKGVSDTYTANYDLYIFDRNAAYEELGEPLTYAQFVENFDKLFGNEYKENVNTRKYFTTVKPSSKLQSTDENYELFNALDWNSTNISFVPQSAEDFYIVRLKLTDNRSQTSTYNFATVAASIQANPLKGESEWLQNNITSVILLSVAGVLFIAFIVLLVFKPKDKGDIDEVFEKENNTKKGKKKKS